MASDCDKIRIAFFEPYFSTFYGAQKSMATLVTNLPVERYEPVVVVPGEGAVAERFRSADVRVVVLPARDCVNRFGGRIRAYKGWEIAQASIELLRYSWRVYKWLQRERVDLVYVNNVRGVAYVWAAAKLARVPLLVYVRDDQRVAALHWLVSLAANRVLTVSDGARKVFTEQELRRLNGRIQTLYTGFEFRDYPVGSAGWTAVRAQVRRRYGVTTDATVVAVIGALVPRKGQDVFIEAARQVADIREDTVFWIVGHEPPGYECSTYVQHLSKRVEELGLADRLRFLGYQRDIWDVYAAVDVVVLPSKGEGLPRVLIEALASGCAVVASDVSGVREIISDESVGSIVSQLNPRRLAEAILREIESQARRRHSNIAEQSARVKARFGIQSYVDGFRLCVESIVGR